MRIYTSIGLLVGSFLVVYLLHGAKMSEQNTQKALVVRQATYYGVDVTHALRKCARFPRLRISKAFDLRILFGVWDGTPNASLAELVIDYSHSGEDGQQRCKLAHTQTGVFCEADLLVPPVNPEGTTVCQSVPWDTILELARGKKALEVGGPSRGILDGLYGAVAALDNVNFAANTLWESGLETGQPYSPLGKQLGVQHVIDARRLDTLPLRYELIISSHFLEHLANPMAALQAMVSVLQPGGLIISVVPNRAVCFDHLRSYSTFEDILHHFDVELAETESPHLDEILMFHDLSRDAPAGSYHNFLLRSLDNARIRGLHHHVFSFPVLRKMYEHVGLSVEMEHCGEGLHMVIAGKLAT
jgi:SAM-dependent methyltransferase